MIKKNNQKNKDLLVNSVSKYKDYEHIEKPIFDIYKNIILKNIEEAESLKLLAKCLNLDSRNITFQRAIKIGLINNLCTLYNTAGVNKRIVINISKMDDFIRYNSDEFKSWADYIIKTVGMLAYVGQY